MQQSQALDLLKLGKNIFLTGAAGSGKSYVLNKYINYLREHQVSVAVTASTGIAATHIGGQTIHSWSGIGIRDTLSADELDSVVSSDRVKRNLRRVRVLVIDEISMLHAHQLDLVDRVMRRALDPDQAFGGIQVVVCGDFFQLPPVTRHQAPNYNEYEIEEAQKIFAYQSDAWRKADFNSCYLHEQYRQEDDGLLSILNQIRSGTADAKTKQALSLRFKQPTLSKSGEFLEPTRLYARNINVDAINNRHLEKLPSKLFEFQMTTRGFPLFVDGLKRNCLAPAVLQLKVGAQVMFVKNSMEGSYVNGTRGVVEGFEDSAAHLPIVRSFDGRRIVAKPEEWKSEDNGTVRASITQIPLRLAWAITIHKSQGMTLDALEVDLSDAFAPGMGYVALSRVRTLRGLSLLGMNNTALEVDATILEHDQIFQNDSEKNQLELMSIDQSQLIERQNAVICNRFAGNLVALPAQIFQIASSNFKVSEPKVKARKRLAHEITKELVEQQIDLVQIAEQRGVSLGTILSHLEKLKGNADLPDISYQKNILPEAAFTQVLSEFRNSEDGKLAPIYQKFSGVYTFEQLRIVRLFI